MHAVNTTGGDSQAIVNQALAQVTRIATLPEITTKIMAVVDDPESTAEDLEALVSKDPILTARVLKVVNSSFYGVPGKVSSIQQAIVLLGLSGLKNIAIAASLAKLFRGGSLHADFSAQDLWRHSAAVAAAARVIAAATGDDPNEAFLVGLLHDVGIIVELQALRPQLITLFDERAKNPAESFRDAERRIIGATHEDFGLALCRNWGFPEMFQHAVGHHHDPSALKDEGRRIAGIICLADHLAARSGVGFTGTVDPSVFPTYMLDELGLSAATVVEISEKLPEAAGLADQLAAD